MITKPSTELYSRVIVLLNAASDNKNANIYQRYLQIELMHQFDFPS